MRINCTRLKFKYQEQGCNLTYFCYIKIIENVNLKKNFKLIVVNSKIKSKYS